MPVTTRRPGESTVKDYNEAIRLRPEYAAAFYNRCLARRDQGDR